MRINTQSRNICQGRGGGCGELLCSSLHRGCPGLLPGGPCSWVPAGSTGLGTGESRWRARGARAERGHAERRARVGVLARELAERPVRGLLREPLLTRNAEGPTEAGAELAAEGLPEVHASHPDDLAHQEKPLPLQVFAAQVLGGTGGVSRVPAAPCEAAPLPALGDHRESAAAGRMSRGCRAAFRGWGVPWLLCPTEGLGRRAQSSAVPGSPGFPFTPRQRRAGGDRWPHRVPTVWQRG